jgi:hypothetical protein
MIVLFIIPNALLCQNDYNKHTCKLVLVLFSAGTVADVLSAVLAIKINTVLTPLTKNINPTTPIPAHSMYLFLFAALLNMLPVIPPTMPLRVLFAPPPPALLVLPTAFEAVAPLLLLLTDVPLANATTLRILIHTIPHNVAE